MDQKLQAQQLRIAKVFSSDFHFEVPAYQRPYAWEVEHVDQLVDDLVRWANDEAGKKEEDKSPYFLGSIVLVQAGNSVFEVVDGQQRLTTLALLFAAAVERLPAKDAVDLTPLLRETGNKFLNTTDRQRLLPRERDRDFYVAHVAGPGGLAKTIDVTQVTESQRRLWSNAQRILTRFKGMDDAEVTELVTSLLNHCYLVVVSTSDFASAYRIFSVLNDRGLDLSPTDIVKARVIEGTPAAQRDKYTRIWEDLEEDLGRGKFLELFSHIRTIHQKAKLRNLLDELTKAVLMKYNPIHRFVDEQLVPYAAAMAAVQDASFQAAQGADQANRALSCLALIDNVDWLPPALAYIVRHKADGPKVARFLLDLERLAASFMIRRSYVNERIDRYAKILHEIEADADLHRADSPLQLDAAEKHATIAALDGDIYGLVKVRLPLLLRLDSLMSGGGANYSYPTITIEHVLPQNPESGSHWETDFPHEDERVGWLNRLGNLVLLTRRKNSAASNRAFDKKKTEYFVKNGVSPFAITTAVINEQAWTADVLERRQKDAVDRLCKEWRLH